MSAEKRRGGLLSWLKGGTVSESTAPNLDRIARIRAERPQTELTSRFEDEGEVGKGGMASVRRVHDTNLLRRVAMKVLDPQIAQIRSEAERFIEEAQITGQLEHPNIPPVHELGIDDEGTYYFTMKLIQGETLDALLKRDFQINRENDLFRVLQVFLKVCQALSYAHEKGIVHCDLKPANVMVGTHGQVYVMDWGIARLSGRSRPSGADVARDRVVLSRKGEDSKITGTAQYMSPEQANGVAEAIDERTDVYCLGGILFRILTGKPPHTGTSLEQILDKARAGDVPPPEALVPSTTFLPPRLVQIALKALAPKPADRYQTVDAMREDVEAWLRGDERLPVKTFAKGDLIVKEGEPGRSAYIIRSGRCVAFKTVNGQRKVLRMMVAGDVFGEASIFTAGNRTASVEASEKVEATEVTRETLDGELAQSVWIGQLLKPLAERFVEVDRRATRLQRKVDDTELLRAVLLHLAFEGTAHESGKRAATWSGMCKRLCEGLGDTPESMLQQVRGLEGVSVDEAADLVLVERPAS